MNVTNPFMGATSFPRLGDMEKGRRDSIAQKATACNFDTLSLFFIYIYDAAVFQQPSFSASLRPMSTPMTEAIIRPRVQPEESPRQCRPLMLVSRFSSIFTLLE